MNVSRRTVIAGMAAAFNTRFANGGAWPHHNMHLHAGLANGSLVEYHSVAVQCCELVFDDLPKPANGVLSLPETPGLGFAPNPDRLAELARADGVIPAHQKAPPGGSRTRAFFDENEDLLRTYWAKNAHYVFFKETPLRGTGRFGELIPGRSIAVDTARVPLGALLWLRTEVARLEHEFALPVHGQPA